MLTASKMGARPPLEGASSSLASSSSFRRCWPCLRKKFHLSRLRGCDTSASSSTLGKLLLRCARAICANLRERTTNRQLASGRKQLASGGCRRSGQAAKRPSGQCRRRCQCRQVAKCEVDAASAKRPSASRNAQAAKALQAAKPQVAKPPSLQPAPARQQPPAAIELPPTLLLFAAARIRLTYVRLAAAKRCWLPHFLVNGERTVHTVWRHDRLHLTTAQVGQDNV
jgi:hypothetical protein